MTEEVIEIEGWAGEEKSSVQPSLVNFSEQFPNVDYFLHRPVMAEPPLCFLKDLEDGTYSILDLQIMHELLDLKDELKGEIEIGND